MTKARRRRASLALLLVALAAAIVAWQYRGYLTADPDERAVSFERWKRHSAFAAGYSLPGTPDLAALETRLRDKGLALGAPVFIRIFKREFELEMWLLKGDRFERFATYPICRWSGRLGPKLRQGDRQAPEGFYSVSSSSLNPRSRWHRSFNLGFPNAFDRTHKRTGSFLMVHGGCSSIGCYAMTNPVIDEIWKLVTSALDKGQARFQVQVMPFRMTAENLASRATSPHARFWRDLKVGFDLFEDTGRPPRVRVCNGRYAFEPGGNVTDGSSQLAVKCPRVKSAG